MAENGTVNLKWYNKFSYRIVTTTENFFYKLGCSVASSPWKTISICWGIVFLSALGFLRFHQEKNPIKLWVPPHSTFMDDTEWLMSKFQNGYREQIIIITAPDVLTPEVFLKVSEIDDKIKNIVTPGGVSWDDVCFKIPHVDLGTEYLLNSFRGSNNDSESLFDPSSILNAATYCRLVESFEKKCFEKNLLELWDYNEQKLDNVTKQDILNKVAQYKVNPILGNMKNYMDLLGGVQRNETGHIVSAKSLQILYMAYVNFSAVDMDKAGNLAGTADWASETCLEWENAFSDQMHEISKNVSDMEVFYSAARSFGDISSATMFQDIDILVFGIFIMVIYVQFVISKFNFVEARILLGGVGMLAVVMAFVVGCGLCSLLGIFYGPVHTSLPFLLMGLGVDDMFVIMACWDELTTEQKRLPLPQRVGHMLKHAGVSITVTSVTDVVAFLIGSSTILPCLESFCLYAAAGVSMTFVFVVTFYTACFTLDQRRVEENRNGAYPCYKHKKYKFNQCSQKQTSNKVFHWIYSKVIFTLPGKILVILITVICLGFSIDSTLKLEQKFDPTWFIPKYTYLAKYLEKQKEFYPTMGYDAGIYMGSINYTQEIRKIRNVMLDLENSTDIGHDINNWLDPFHKYVREYFRKDVYNEVLSNNEFNLFLSKFLFSPLGARFQANFRFNKALECGIPAPNITMSSISFRLRNFAGPKEYLPAMHKAIDITKNANFTTGDRFSTAWSKIFGTWITDELIDIEVSRNLLLALLCVMACTILLIANLKMCFLVFTCVLLTMINVCGFMQRWGLTIDLVSCIGLELAIGLCVDYASHIGHTFLTVQDESRQLRSLRTVTSIGSAVLYGGISTMIGVSMLSQTEAYGFHVFFKIFVLVVIFGLFHGVVFLPVVLSWVGPDPYHTHKPIQQFDTQMT